MPESRIIDHELFEVRRANSDQESMWDGYKFGVPGAYAVYFNDFFTYNASDWTITTLEAGAGSATEVITDEVGGVLLLTMAAGDNDSDDFSKVGEAFLPAAGKRIYYEARVKISDATQSDMFIGLSDTDTTLIDGVSEGIYFHKDDGDTNIDFSCTNGSVLSQEFGVATIGTSYIKYGFKVTGTNLCEFWIDDVKKGQLTTNIPTAEVCVSFAIQNGEAVAKTMSIDYIFAAIER